MTPSPSPTLRTPAWRLIGLVRSEPGVLAVSGGRLSFSTGSARLFDVRLSEIEAVVFPWYYVGAGVQLRVGGDLYRLSFVLPNDSVDPQGPGIRDGRRAGKAWRALLVRE